MLPEPSYECSLDREARKERGAYYTPAPIVRQMVDRVLSHRLEACHRAEDVLKISVYDPSCGDGRFLVEARDRMLARLVAIGSAVDGVELARRCLHGADVDAVALKAARAKLPGANLKRADTLRASRSRQFDVVIGNPPYGAKVSVAGDSARLFIAHALDVLARGGSHAFIVPKGLLYSSTWLKTLLRLMPGIVEIVDCGKLWPEVKLEQVIYVYEDVARGRQPTYRSLVRRDERILCLGVLEKSSLAEFGLALNGVSADELRLGRKLLAAGSTFGALCRNTRGAPLQAALKPRGEQPVFGGRELRRFGMRWPPRGYLTPRGPVDPRALVEAGTILAQNIVAHVTRPAPHLKIAAALAPPGPAILALDTINKINWYGPYSREAALAILNSRLVSWYVYRFVVGGAVRTIHFDSRVTNRIPFPKHLDAALDRELAGLAHEMSVRPSAAADAEIDRLVSVVFGLGKGEARAVRV